MKLVMDACTLILLAKASVLETVLKNFEVSTTQEVYDEVLAGKENKFEDAFLVERLRHLMTIVKGKESKKFAKDFNMGEGEASIIAFAVSNKKYIVATDNRQGRKAARVSMLPLVGSMELIVNLNTKGKINKEKAVSALKSLQKEGWFDNYLIEKALEDVK